MMNSSIGTSEKRINYASDASDNSFRPTIVYLMLVESVNGILPQPLGRVGELSKAIAVISRRKQLVHECSTEFLTWTKSHSHEACLFSKMLVDMLKRCFSAKQSKIGKPGWRESVWRKFHEVRSSVDLETVWKTLPQPLYYSISRDPIFKQMVLSNLIEKIIRHEYPIIATESASCEDKAIGTVLSEDEEKVIRYIAGYIPVSLRKKLERSSHPHKEEFILCLWSMCEDEDETNADNFLTYTKSWIERVNRGGLFPVSNGAYLLFKQLEIEIQKVYNLANLKTESIPLRKEAIKKLLESEDVYFYWYLLSEELEDIQEDSRLELLQMIVDLWITIRCYSFAKSVMELHKQLYSLNTSKAKSLRKSIT